jgi:hypothetical protein
MPLSFNEGNLLFSWVVLQIMVQSQYAVRNGTLLRMGKVGRRGPGVSKKSWVFGVFRVNPWWVCLPISWPNGGQRCNVFSCNLDLLICSLNTTFQSESRCKIFRQKMSHSGYFCLGPKYNWQEIFGCLWYPLDKAKPSVIYLLLQAIDTNGGIHAVWYEFCSLRLRI